MLREDGCEEEVRGGQRRVAAELDLERRRGRTLVSRFKNEKLCRVKGSEVYEDLGGGGEPPKLEPRGGAAVGGVAEEEGGLG